MRVGSQQGKRDLERMRLKILGGDIGRGREAHEVGKEGTGVYVQGLGVPANVLYLSYRLSCAPLPSLCSHVSLLSCYSSFIIF